MIRIVEGCINKILCQHCDGISYTFTFSGDSDVVTAGLSSLTSIVAQELVLFEMTGNEWTNDSGQEKAKERISKLLKRDDLEPVHFLRAEDNNHYKGSSFRKFLASYKAPTITYACPKCEVGEAREIGEVSIDDFETGLGKITCLDGLQLNRFS